VCVFTSPSQGYLKWLGNNGAWFLLYTTGLRPFLILSRQPDEYNNSPDKRELIEHPSGDNPSSSPLHGAHNFLLLRRLHLFARSMKLSSNTTKWEALEAFNNHFDRFAHFLLSVSTVLLPVDYFISDVAIVDFWPNLVSITWCVRSGSCKRIKKEAGLTPSESLYPGSNTFSTGFVFSLKFFSFLLFFPLQFLLFYLYLATTLFLFSL
jgi:hypothetical protein